MQVDEQNSNGSRQGMLTVRDVCQFLNVHPNSVRRWADLGLLRAYRVGPRGDRRFRRDDVDAFLLLSTKSKAIPA